MHTGVNTALKTGSTINQQNITKGVMTMDKKHEAFLKDLCITSVSARLRKTIATTDKWRNLKEACLDGHDSNKIHAYERENRRHIIGDEIVFSAIRYLSADLDELRKEKCNA